MSLKFRIKSANVIYTSAIIIIAVALIRLLDPFLLVPNEPFQAIYYFIIIICLGLLVVVDPSIVKLTPIPILCSILILVSSLVNGFEHFRATIILSFVAQLYTMYVFKNITFRSTKSLVKVFQICTYLVGIIAIFMLVLGIKRFWGLGTYIIENGIVRNLSGILSNQAYLGYFSSLVICIVLFSGKLNVKKYLIIFYLLLIILASSSRESLIGTIFVVALHLITKKYRFFLFRWSTIALTALMVFLFVIIWLNSPFNFKSPDSGRLILFASAINIIRDNVFFGSSELELHGGFAVAQAHNFFLSTWAQFGIFVLLGYLIFFFWFFVNSGRRGRILLAYQFLSFFTSPLFGVGFSSIFFIVMLLTAYFNYLDKQEKEVLVEHT